MFDLGSPVPLSVNVTDATGALAAASSVALTITLPDGTTATPDVSTASTGVYTATYVSTQAGRHVASWVASGANASTYNDVFNVRPATVGAIVGLAETKAHLNIDNSDDDDELRGFIAAASAVIESYVGACVRRTVVENHTGRSSVLIPRHAPHVLSVTTVVEDGSSLTQDTDFKLSDNGMLTRMHWLGWSGCVDGIVLTYVAGRSVIPENILEATMELIRVNWRPQRGGDGPVFDAGTSDLDAPSLDELRMGFFVPGRVVELLKPNLAPRINFA